MKHSRAMRRVFTVILIFCTGTTMAGLDDLPEVTADGLHRVPDTKLNLVYADPAADLSGYQRVLLIDAQVSFRKDWKRDINYNKPYSISTQDMQDIKANLSALFGEVFTAALTEGGYTITQEQAEDVLIVRPAIMDLNVSSPKTRTDRTRNITRSAGAMTLYLELRDSVTGDVLVKALDYQYDRSEVQAYLQDKTRNEMAARKMLGNWAEILVSGLDEARSVASDREQPSE